MNGLIVATLQLLSILGWGLGLLYLLKFTRRLTNIENIVLALPLGLGLNGWLLFLLGLFDQLNVNSSVVLLVIGLSGFIFLYPRQGIILGTHLNTLGYLFLAILSYIFGLDLIEAITPPGDGDTLAYHFAFPKMVAEKNSLVFLPRAVDGAVPLLIQLTYAPLLLLGGEIAATSFITYKS